MQKIVETDQHVVDEVERTKWKTTLLTLAKDWRLYVLLIPMLAFLICFKYLPITGILTGFKWGNDNDTLYNSQWCGLYWANQIIAGNQYALMFWRAFRNTFVNSMYGLLFGFPIPIFLALLFSEIKCQGYRSVLQVAAYLPHFVSTVVVATIITLWCEGEVQTSGGIIYRVFKTFGWMKTDSGSTITTTALNQPKFFRPIYRLFRCNYCDITDKL